ncbi:uncharacterized protein UHOR_08887 [Ustilago hordei]|uniref:Uncharacterized protein n=1 Tax=Ustilago hordei TaxID=120017 RepID=I2FN80_USTHO|nr:uncharacterized protein UHOR_08887 [Ustilago hordei]
MIGCKMDRGHGPDAISMLSRRSSHDLLRIAVPRSDVICMHVCVHICTKVQLCSTRSRTQTNLVWRLKARQCSCVSKQAKLRMLLAQLAALLISLSPVYIEKRQESTVSRPDKEWIQGPVVDLAMQQLSDSVRIQAV